MFEQIFKNIDDVLWKEAGCSSELDYTEQTSWVLFLKHLDDLEGSRAIEAELLGKQYAFIIDGSTIGPGGPHPGELTAALITTPRSPAKT